MSEDVKIDGRLNFIIPIENSQGEYNKVFINFIPKASFDDISPILGEIFSRIQRGLNPDVFVTDWSMVVNDICKKLEDVETLRLKLDGFFERTLMSSKVLTFKGEVCDYTSLKKDHCWDETSENNLRGFLLFISALWRYTAVKRRQKLLLRFVTSQSISEWENSQKKLSKGQINTSQPLTKIQMD